MTLYSMLSNTGELTSRITWIVNFDCSSGILTSIWPVENCQGERSESLEEVGLPWESADTMPSFVARAIWERHCFKLKMKTHIKENNVFVKTIMYKGSQLKIISKGKICFKNQDNKREQGLIKWHCLPQNSAHVKPCKAHNSWHKSTEFRCRPTT